MDVATGEALSNSAGFGPAPLDEFSFHARLSGMSGVALVLFTSPDCGTCRRVEGLLPQAIESGIALFRVDVQQSLALARQYEVLHLPALFLFRDGHYHARIESMVTPQALATAIATALSLPAQEEP